MAVRPTGAAKIRLLVTLLAALVAGGCQVSNQAIRADFTDFNTIIQFNQAQQMLLNLVRLHYREAPLFLQAGALSAAYESRTGASAGISVESGTSRTSGVGVDYAFAAKPTITYTPVEGKAYVQQFMSEISLDTMGLLLRSGWPVGRLAELTIERVVIGDDVLINDPKAPSYPRFVALIDTLQQAQDAGRLRVTTESGAQVVRAGTQTIPADALILRSLFDVMFVAAKNVETPSGHLSRVRAGEANGALVIHSSAAMPADAMVWVQHAGYYFSIDDSDLRSKDTFALLMQIARIQASAVSASPVMTLPVR